MSEDLYKQKIKELESRIEKMQHIAEQLVVVAFSPEKLRYYWRGKFGLPTKCIESDNGDMP